MKKMVSVLLTLVFALAFTVIGCQTGTDKSPLENAESYQTGRWVKCSNAVWKGKDCFQLRRSAAYPSGINKATGKPWSESKRITKRNAAREAARLMAINDILAFIKGEKVSSAAGVENFEVTGQAIAAESEGQVKNAFVLKEEYDEEDSCSLIIEVQLDKSIFKKGTGVE